MKSKITLKGTRLKLSKIFFVVALAITGIFTFVFLFISPLAKYLLEKYDVELSGREVKIDWAYVNPFTGYIYLSNPKIYELNSDSLALTADGISANIALMKLFSKTIDIGELVLEQPRWMIAQKGDKRALNFGDLIEKFSSNGAGASGPSIHFIISSLKINEGDFYYHENMTPINYFVKKVNITSTKIGWGADSIAFKYAFLAGIGKGSMNGAFTINVDNLDYKLTADIKKYDLQMIEQYLKDMINYGKFTANLDAKINAIGSFRDAGDLNMNGKVNINDFHFGKKVGEDYAAFNKFSLDVIELSPKNNKYIFDTVLLNEPFLLYEHYDNLDNFQTIFGKGGGNVINVSGNTARFNLILEIANYVEKLAKNFFRSYYQVNRLEINKANFQYEEYSLSEKFSAGVYPFFMEADSIDKRKEMLNVTFRSGIKPYGNAVLDLSINPRDSSDFDLQYHIDKVPLTLFNPYLLTYTSFPLDRGTMEVKGTWKVRNGNIQSRNHLVIIDPRVGDRVKNKDTKWVPVPLMMAFVRERGNVIDYEIPITGDLKNPKFHLKDAIIDLLKNILIKPPMTYSSAKVRGNENEIEKSLSVKWEMRQGYLTKSQKKFARKMANFLEENPEASITVNPIQYTTKEKEHILFYEAKKKYFLIHNSKTLKSFTEDDSMFIVKMSVKDSLFIKYLNKHCNTHLVFTTQEKCRLFVGDALVNKRFDQLIKQRVSSFRFYFKENGSNKRLKIYNSKNDIPFNGFSYYRITYKGELPQSLIRAYQKMDKFNNEAPRNKFKKKRSKSPTNIIRKDK
ncbi:MAG: DUF748 domain-containing protein [Bacteroidota bacterium]|nr:DUF748 domain-containing protein [Bacteroidota bacterium]